MQENRSNIMMYQSLTKIVRLVSSSLSTKQNTDIRVGTDWVTVTNIAPLSTLEDTLQSLPLSHQNAVEEARLILSTLGRPIGWFLRFPNPTLVQSLLHTWKQNQISKTNIDNQYPLFPTYKNGLTQSPVNDDTKEYHDENVDLSINDGHKESEEEKATFQVGGRQLMIKPYIPVELTNGTKQQPRQPDASARFYHPSFSLSILWELDSSVIRVENCSVDTTMEDIQQLFLPYELQNVDLLLSGSGAGNAQKHHQLKSLSNVQTIKQKNNYTRAGSNFTPLATHTFLLRMSSPDYARAAIREKQMCYLLGRQIRLTAYPDQLLVAK